MGKEDKLFLALNSSPQTVAEYLEDPTGVSSFRKISDLLLIISCLSWLFVIFIVLIQEGMFSFFPIIYTLAEAFNLHAALLPCIIGGSVSLLFYLVFFFIEKKIRISKHNTRESVKKAVLSSVLLSQSRFGIGLQTPMSKVSLNCEYLGRGAGHDAIKCSWRVPFMRDDFAGTRASAFGAVDFEVVDGQLFVFLTVEAKKRFVENLGA